MRPYRVPFGPSVTFFAARSWAGYITNMSGFDLRQGQPRKFGTESRNDHRGRSGEPNPGSSSAQQWIYLAGQEALKPAGRSFDDPAIPGAVRLHRIAK